MEAFYVVTLVAAVTILIIILTVLGVLMSYQTNKLSYPPKASTCPDYWTFDGQNCQYPTSGPNRGTYITATGPVQVDPSNVAPFAPDIISNWHFSPTDPKWTTKQSAICAQHHWATTNQIEWDGVSNYAGCA